MNYILFGENQLSRHRVKSKVNFSLVETSNIGELINFISEKKNKVCLLFLLESQEDLKHFKHISNTFKIRECLIIPIVNKFTRSLAIKEGFNPINHNEQKDDFLYLIYNMISYYSKWEKEVTDEVIEHLETYINTVKDKVNSPLAAISLQSQYCLYEDTPIEENKVLDSFLKELKDVIKQITSINLRKLETKEYSKTAKVYKV